MDHSAFQDHILPMGHICFGCGADNPHGMQIRSTWEEGQDVATCTWQPKPHHCGGEDFVNGGVIATVIDCHSFGTAIAWLYRLEGRAMDSAPTTHCVTASMHVDFLRPTPLAQPVILRATPLRVEGRRVTVACSVRSGDVETVRCEGVFVRVSAAAARDRGRSSATR
ncbi:MAG: PaaI family thioesterase [Candidatus Lambdaproteobacteria bacterium]|nr:PaaI family thioesterase [Candidatus Lambdaproteobacteria bacterium]